MLPLWPALWDNKDDTAAAHPRAAAGVGAEPPELLQSWSQQCSGCGDGRVGAAAERGSRMHGAKQS